MKWELVSWKLENTKIGRAKIILKKIEDIDINSKEEKKVEPFSKLNLKVAKVLSVSEHYKADKLLLINVDLGNDDTRQLVAGLKPYFDDPEKELVGRKIVVLSNLEHANLRGEKSEGMLLAAETKDSKTVEPLTVKKSKPGDQVFVEGIEPGKETIKFDDFLNVSIYVQDGKVMYKDKQLQTEKEKINAKKVGDGKVR